MAIRIPLKIVTPPSACSTGQIYHLRTTHSNYHEICKNCTCILFFVEILTISVHDCCTIALHSEEYDKPSHALVFSLCFQFSCYSYNFHFVFNSLNSASAEGASTLNDVSVIIVYSITLFKLFDEWHLTFYDLKLFYQLIRNEFNNFFFNDSH